MLMNQIRMRVIATYVECRLEAEITKRENAIEIKLLIKRCENLIIYVKEKLLVKKENKLYVCPDCNK